MGFLKKALILFSICFAGDIIAMFLPFPFPGTVLAMVLLFIFLLSGVVKTKQIEPVAGWLTKNMSLVFIPPTVSIVGYIDVINSILWQFLTVCIVSAFITFLCTAYSVKLTMWLINRRKETAKNA